MSKFICFFKAYIYLHTKVNNIPDNIWERHGNRGRKINSAYKQDICICVQLACNGYFKGKNHERIYLRGVWNASGNMQSYVGETNRR